MRYTSDILYRTLRAYRTGDATPEVQALTLPPGLMPVFSARGPLTFGQGFLTTVTQRESFQISQQVTVANAATTSTVLARLGQGMWDVQVWITYIANYTIADGSANGARLILSDADVVATTRALANVWPATNIGQSTYWSSIMLLENEPWEFGIVMGTNGVGQAHTANVHIMAHRLN